MTLFCSLGRIEEMQKKSDNVFKSIDTRRIAINAIFIGAAMIMFLIENLFDPIRVLIPGAKMGLSNIFSLVGMIILGPVDAFIIVVVRSLLSVMFGAPASALMYSLSGGLVALGVMFLLYQFVFPNISIVAISVAGAVMHNITQVLVLCIMVRRWEMVSYLPMLSVAGVAAGIIVGIAGFFIIKYLPIKVYYKPRKTGGAPVPQESKGTEAEKEETKDED